MSHPIYTIEELLHLRQSPLIKKPESLRSSEEWMGAGSIVQGDKAAAIASKPRKKDGTRLQSEVYSSAPEGRSLVHPKTASFGARDETHLQPDFSAQIRGIRPQAKRVNSENVTLGPPKTQFNSSKSRTRPGDDGEAEHSQSSASQDAFGHQQGPNYSTIQQRTHDGDLVLDYCDPLRNRSNQLDQELSRSEQESKDAKFAGNWRAGIQSKESPVTRKPRRDVAQGRDWRTSSALVDIASPDRNGDRNPEWMDATLGSALEDSRGSQQHTAEDFQRWKESMKAEQQKQQGIPMEDDHDRRSSLLKDPPRKISNVASGGSRLDLAKLELGSRDLPSFWDLDVGDGADKENILGLPKAGERKTRGSRFAAMFSTPVTDDIPAQEPQPPNQGGLPAITSAEDQQGFQRILQMLGGAGLSSGVLPSTTLFPAPGPDTAITNPKSPSWKSNPLLPPLPESGPLSAAMQRSQSNADDAPHERPRSSMPSDPNSAFLLSLMVQPRKQSEPVGQAVRDPPSPINTRGQSSRVTQARDNRQTDDEPINGEREIGRRGSAEAEIEQPTLRRGGPPGLGRQPRTELQPHYLHDPFAGTRPPPNWQPERNPEPQSRTMGSLAGKSMTGLPSSGTQGLNNFDSTYGFPRPSPPGMPPHPSNQGPQGMNPITSNLQQILQQGSQPSPQWAGPHNPNPNASYRTMPSKPIPPPGIMHNNNHLPNPINNNGPINSPLPPIPNQSSNMQDPLPYPYPPLPHSLPYPHLQHQQQQQQQHLHSSLPPSSQRHPQPLQHSDPPRPMPYRQEQQLRQQMTQPLPLKHPHEQQQPHPGMHKGFPPWMMAPGGMGGPGGPGGPGPGQNQGPMPPYLRQGPEH